MIGNSTSNIGKNAFYGQGRLTIAVIPNCYGFNSHRNQSAVIWHQTTMAVRHKTSNRYDTNVGRNIALRRGWLVFDILTGRGSFSHTGIVAGGFSVLF
jgi:hypothetical protein